MMQNEKTIAIGAGSCRASGSERTGRPKGALPARAAAKVVPPASTAERWVHYVLGACRSEKDPRTIAVWSREIAVSYTTLCESCRLMNIQPRQARDFARFLRIILMPSFDLSQLSTVIDISDRRTLASLLRKAGLGTQAGLSSRLSVTEFLDNQHFIPKPNPGLNVLRELLCDSTVTVPNSVIERSH